MTDYNGTRGGQYVMAAARPGLTREMKRLGANLRAWRKINGLTAEMVAERARISRDTLRAIENGQSTSSANLIAAMQVVGVLGPAVDATDPVNSDFGVRNLARADVARVRQRRNQGVVDDARS